MSEQYFSRALILIGILMGCGIVLGLDLIRRQYFLASSQPPPLAKEKSFYPTIVPFKQNRQDCEESGRQWQEGECIDQEHSPVF